MSKMYYLFSKQMAGPLEAIYICQNNRSIECATHQTGVYPLGLMLSKILKLLELRRKCKNPFFLDGEAEFTREFQKLLDENSSFSNIGFDDYYIRGVLATLLVDSRDLVQDDKFQRLPELLRSYTNYIYRCLENPDFCSFDALKLLVSENNHSLPPSSIYIGPKQNALRNSNTSLNGDVDELLSIYNTIEHEAFAPRTLTWWNSRFHELNTKETAWAPLFLPINIFEIHDIVDLILASLQCIFESGYIVRECRYCHNMFITRKRTSFCCPYLSSKKGTSCAQLKRHQDRVERESTEWYKMEKSVRTMLSRKLASNSSLNHDYPAAEHRDFLDRASEWRTKIKNGEATGDEYIAWLKQFYKRKYRKEKTDAET